MVGFVIFVSAFAFVVCAIVYTFVTLLDLLFWMCFTFARVWRSPLFEGITFLLLLVYDCMPEDIL